MTDQILFFPFTHISRNQQKTLLAFFPSFQYLPGRVDFKDDQVLNNLCEQGRIIPLFSSAGQVEAIEKKVEEYLAWARMHKGNEHNLKSLLQDHPYFTSDTHVTAIKSQIKGVKDDKKASFKDDSALESHLLFLKMAQLYDEQNEHIDLELKALDKTRAKLVSTLRGLEDHENTDKNMGENIDPGTLMTRERILAWSGCMALMGAYRQEGSNPLFVTTSEAVFDYIESNCKELVNTLDIEQIKVHENECENSNEWQQHLSEVLMRAIQGDGSREINLPELNDRCSLSGQIKHSFFSGNTINELFNMSDKQISVCLIQLK